MAKKARNVVTIDPNQIVVSDRQRQDLGDIETMKASIEAKGQLQPITITPDMRLLMGGRRLETCKQLGIKVDCLIRETEDELDEREIELFENLHRKDMTWQEQARATARIHELMVEKHGDNWSQRRTAKLLGKSSHAAINDAIQMVQAMEAIPDLANMPTADAARKRVNRVLTDMKVQRGLKEASAEMASRWAAEHYHVGNCIEGLAQVADRVAHFAEVDPPYAIDLQEKRAARNEGETSVGIDTYNEIPANIYPQFLLEVASQTYRVLSDNAFCVWWYGPTWHCEVITALRKVGFHVDDIPAIWTKNAGTTNNPNVFLPRFYEPFFVCRKGNPALRQKGRPGGNVFDFAGVPESQRIHATERPLELVREILRTFAWPQARVVVPFLGSGNTLLAAYHEGMVGWGYDLSEKHRDRFLHRVNEHFPEGVKTDG